MYLSKETAWAYSENRMLLVVAYKRISMRNKSSFPMDEVDVHLLTDIIEHFLGEGRESAEAIDGELETVQDGYNPSFQNDVAESIIDDLSRIVDRAPPEMDVADVSDYDPESDAEANFLDLDVKGYVKMRRDYFEECHDPYR